MHNSSIVSNICCIARASSDFGLPMHACQRSNKQVHNVLNHQILPLELHLSLNFEITNLEFQLSNLGGRLGQEQPLDWQPATGTLGEAVPHFCPFLPSFPIAFCWVVHIIEMIRVGSSRNRAKLPGMGRDLRSPPHLVP